MKTFFKLLIIASSLFLFSNIQVVYAEHYEIKELNVTIDVHKNSTMNVKEEFLVNYSIPRHGIIRWIPLYYIVDGIKASTLDIYNVQIFRNDKREPFSEYRENGNKVLKIGSANKYVNNYQRYTINYDVYGAFDFTNQKDLFSWNITGNDHGTNIHKVNFTIQFPVDISNNIPYFYIGSYGSTKKINDYYPNGNKINFSYHNILTPGNGITIFMDFDKGVFKELSGFEKFLHYVKKCIIDILIMLGTFLAIFLTWLKFGKDDYVAIPVRYYPPEGMDPCKFGFLLDDRSSPNEVISLIFYWASKGYIKIKEEGNDTYLIKLKDLVSENNYENKLFNLLFKGGKFKTSLGLLEAERKEKEMQILNKNYYTVDTDEPSLDTIYKEVQKDAEVKGIYTSSSLMARNIMLVMLLLLPILVIILHSTILRFSPITPVTLIITFLTFICIALSNTFMLKKTPFGNKLYSEVKGFEDFLKKVENPQIEVLMREEVDYVNKVLPYAVAAGVSNEFLKKMKKLMLSLPSWYEGNNNFASFNKTINSSVKSLSTSLTPPPARSHTSIGGASGGFSGGGHGGGGSGSW